MRWIRLQVAIMLAVAPADAAGKPHRHFAYAKIVKLHDGSLSFRARVEHYPDGFIALMKKNCKSCTWHRVALRHTTKFGRIFMKVGSPAHGRWYWRYRTPESKTYAVTFSSTWYTYRT
jgi:hypothetical protein